MKRGDQGKWAAYCEVQPAAQRTLLRLPDGKLGFEKVKAEDKVKVEAEQPIGLEAQHVIAWALRHPTPVDLGPCDKLGEIAPRALALMPEKSDEGAQVLVDLAAAMDPNAGPVAGDTAQPVTSAGSAGGRPGPAATASRSR